MGLAGTAGLPKGRCLTRCQVTPVGVRWLREALLPTMSHIAWYQSRIEDRVVVTVATLGVSACHPSPTIRVSTVCPEAGKEVIGIGFEPAKALVRGLPATATPTAGQIPNIGGVHGTEGVGTTSDRMVAGGGGSTSGDSCSCQVCMYPPQISIIWRGENSFPRLPVGYEILRGALHLGL